MLRDDGKVKVIQWGQSSLEQEEGEMKLMGLYIVWINLMYT